MPCRIAWVSTKVLNVDPGWRSAWVAKLNWFSSENRWLEAIARM